MAENKKSFILYADLLKSIDHLTFEEKGIIAEKFPEVEIKSVTAPQVRLLQAEFFKDEKLKELYYEEMIGTECTAVFMNAGQNYPLLKGQQTNLYSRWPYQEKDNRAIFS